MKTSASVNANNASGKRAVAKIEPRVLADKAIVTTDGVLLATKRQSPEHYGPDNFFNFIDKSFQAKLARLTLGVSPASLVEILFSWAAHLAIAPGKSMSLALYPARHAQDILSRLVGGNCPDCPDDPRFRSESWKK